MKIPKTTKLFYLAKPVYGGWVTFSAHLSKCTGLNLYKPAKRTEAGVRDFGYGVKYRNVEIDKVNPSQILITAVDKDYYKYLPKLAGATIVIHDPTELKPELLGYLSGMNIITIRKTVHDLLLEYGLKSELAMHPFFLDDKPAAKNRTENVSLCRIDFDKNTDIILNANKMGAGISIYGSKNRLYIHHKLSALNFDKYYKGSPKKDYKEVYTILQGARTFIDMSTIKGDGGGTQYSFLEAIYCGASLILHRDWVNKGDTFIDGYNCQAVATPGELLRAIHKDDQYLETLAENAKKILDNHTKSVT